MVKEEVVKKLPEITKEKINNVFDKRMSWLNT